jgi:hypothetical protein
VPRQRQGPSRWVTLRVKRLEKSTEKAVQVLLEEPEGELVWIPRSQLKDSEFEMEVSADDLEEGFLLEVTLWIAREKGLTDE